MIEWSSALENCVNWYFVQYRIVGQMPHLLWENSLDVGSLIYFFNRKSPFDSSQTPAAAASQRLLVR
jgi:hypothetical protein